MKYTIKQQTTLAGWCGVTSTLFKTNSLRDFCKTRDKLFNTLNPKQAICTEYGLLFIV